MIALADLIPAKTTTRAAKLKSQRSPVFTRTSHLSTSRYDFNKEGLV
jgi:hypothetical protein